MVVFSHLLSLDEHPSQSGNDRVSTSRVEEELNSSISSTITVSNLSAKQNHDEYEESSNLPAYIASKLKNICASPNDGLWDDLQARTVQFDQTVVTFHFPKEESIYEDLWYSQEELDKLLDQTLKSVAEIEECLEGSGHLLYALYELTGQDSKVSRETCRQGIYLLYKQYHDLLGLEEIIFSPIVRWANEDNLSILEALSVIRVDPYTGEEGRACRKASRRISDQSRRWARDLAVAQRKALKRLNN